MPVYKSLKRHKLLLDIHVWIWLMLGDKQLSRSFQSTIEYCKEDELIFVSAISIWELGMLVERKRIQLEIDCFICV